MGRQLLMGQLALVKRCGDGSMWRGKRRRVPHISILRCGFLYGAATSYGPACSRQEVWGRLDAERKTKAGAPHLDFEMWVSVWGGNFLWASLLSSRGEGTAQCGEENEGGCPTSRF